jgi:ElaB/YqjD/DUF883 family membrane-anchored ribosome-binding protein
MNVTNRIASYLPRGLQSDRATNRSEPALPEAGELMEKAETWVKQNPAAALGAAFATGVVIAWWIKRK